MLCKNLQLKEKIWKLPLRFILDMLFAFKSLFSGYSVSFIAVFNAHLSVLKWSFTHANKNRLNKKSLKIMQGVYNDSIVWAYFIKKKKRFSQIVKKNL